MLFFFTGCADAGLNFIGANEPVHTQHYMMGTTVEQRVYGKSAKKATKEVLDKLNQIESSLTINDSGGEVNKLNEAAGKKSVKLSAETMYVLEKAKRYAQLSNGAFDVTIGPLVKAWGIFTQNPNVPSQGEIKNLLKLVSHRSITLDEETSNAKLEKPGQIVDLGGIAKGYAGDEAIKIYRQHGIKSAYISLGGNVVVLGGKPDGSLWRVGIRNPRAENDSYYIGVVSVSDKAIVTSGDYERNFEKDGIRYHHILDPKTGYPSNSGLISATIVADSSIDADALSTATFVLGLENGMKLVESLEGVDAIFITDSSEIYTTSGLKKSFKFDNESKEFKYVKKR
jgi:thiamine biosynthesis lipoprotein